MQRTPPYQRTSQPPNVLNVQVVNPDPPLTTHTRGLEVSSSDICSYRGAWSQDAGEEARSPVTESVALSPQRTQLITQILGYVTLTKMHSTAFQFLRAADLQMAWIMTKFPLCFIDLIFFL